MKTKAIITIMITLFLASMSVTTVLAGKPEGTRIQDGVLTYSPGHYLEGAPLKVGYDIFGYNYQSHMFNGYYANSYLGRDGFPPYEGDDGAYAKRLSDEGYLTDPYEKWYWPYRNVWLMMWWNDAWLSNMDRTGDGLLDRHYGYPTYDGSGAWLTNHQWGTYEVDGEVYRWNYYVAIITPSTADGYYKDSIDTTLYWFDVDGNVVGTVIWGSFARVLQVYNDQGTGEHGVLYLSEVCPGFGYY